MPRLHFSLIPLLVLLANLTPSRPALAESPPKAIIVVAVDPGAGLDAMALRKAIGEELRMDAVAPEDARAGTALGTISVTADRATKKLVVSYRAQAAPLTREVARRSPSQYRPPRFRRSHRARRATSPSASRSRRSTQEPRLRSRRRVPLHRPSRDRPTSPRATRARAKKTRSTNARTERTSSRTTLQRRSADGTTTCAPTPAAASRSKRGTTVPSRSSVSAATPKGATRIQPCASTRPRRCRGS